VRGFLFNFGIKNSKSHYRGPDIILEDGRTVEVKMRRKTFTGVADFPEKNAIIETKVRYDKKIPPPIAYIIVSHDTGKMVCTRGDTPYNWLEKSVPNNNGGKAIAYVCPKVYLRPIESLIKYLQ